MARNKRDSAQQINPKSVDPDTGELVDAGEPPAAKKPGVLDALKQAALAVGFVLCQRVCTLITGMPDMATDMLIPNTVATAACQLLNLVTERAYDGVLALIAAG